MHIRMEAPWTYCGGFVRLFDFIDAGEGRTHPVQKLCGFEAQTTRSSEQEMRHDKILTDLYLHMIGWYDFQKPLVL